MCVFTAAAVGTVGLTTGAALSANIALASAALSTGVSMYSAQQASSARKDQANYQAQVAANNATIATWKAEDAIDRGKKERVKHAGKVSRLMGTQRSVLAGQGFDFEEDAIDILSSTAEIGALDGLTIKSNARREAYQHRVAASNSSAQQGLLTTQAGAESPFLAGGSALFAGASSVASKWYTFQKA